MSDEKIALLRSYGAEVVVCPTAVPPEDPRSYYSTAERLVRETPGAFRPDQYSNPANPLAHEQTTGPEIWRQTAGRITHFVAGIGTGGTITGVGHAPEGAEPERADRRRRPVGLGVLGRHRPPVSRRRRRRGLLADDVRPRRRRPRRRGQRRRLVPHRAARHARRRAAHRRLGRHRRARRARGRAAARTRRGRRRAAARLRPQLPLEDLRRPVDVRHGLPARPTARSPATCSRRRATGCPPSCSSLPDEQVRDAITRDARHRRVAARRERHQGAAARGQGSRRARCASSS